MASKQQQQQQKLYGYDAAEYEDLSEVVIDLFPPLKSNPLEHLRALILERRLCLPPQDDKRVQPDQPKLSREMSGSFLTEVKVAPPKPVSPFENLKHAMQSGFRDAPSKADSTAVSESVAPAACSYDSEDSTQYQSASVFDAYFQKREAVHDEVAICKDKVVLQAAKCVEVFVCTAMVVYFTMWMLQILSSSFTLHLTMKDV
jgi:hypothetical protein